MGKNLDQQNVLFSYFPSSELPLINEFADEMEKILNNSFAEVQKVKLLYLLLYYFVHETFIKIF